MRKTTALGIVLVASLVALGCDQGAPTAAKTAPAVSAKAAKLTSFTFTKIPAAIANQTIASPAAGLETIVFQMDAARAAGMVVKQFGFMISGSLQAGDVGNYTLLYYPKGLDKPGVVMGTNDGSTWVAPGGNTFIFITLASPITIPNGKSFTAVFALRADVTGTGAFFFDSRVQTCLVNDGSGDTDVGTLGGDLPLQGDVYFVNRLPF